MDVDALKEAAIAAYMRSEGYEKQGDGYMDYGLGYSSYVGSDGTGTTTYSTGGPFPSTSDVDYTSQWSDVRSRVDTDLEDWQDDRMPEPGAINGRVNTAKLAVTALNVGNSTSFGGALGGYLATISENSPKIRGEAGNAFNNSFANQLPATISNHGCLAALVVEALSAEEEIWRQARVDRDNHVEKSTEALNAYAESEEPGHLKFILALSGAAIAGAGAVATGGIAAPFAIATAGVTALSATNDYIGEVELERSGADYEELMTAFEEGLGDIDQGITDQETLVKESLEAAWNVFEANRPLFDLTPRVTDDGDGDFDDETSLFEVQDGADHELVLPGQAVLDSLYSGLNNLGFDLGDAAPKVVTGADDGGLLSSSAREIGLQYNSASIWMWIIGDNNSSSLRDLAWDVKNGNRMLQSFVRDVQDADATSQAGLDQLRGALSGGSGEDPWA